MYCTLTSFLTALISLSFKSISVSKTRCKVSCYKMYNLNIMLKGTLIEYNNILSAGIAIQTMTHLNYLSVVTTYWLPLDAISGILNACRQGSEIIKAWFWTILIEYYYIASFKIHCWIDKKNKWRQLQGINKVDTSTPVWTRF